MMYEGEALLGHWLPRALADIAVLLGGFGGAKVTRKDFLAMWGLPHAVRVEQAEDEESRQTGLNGLADWINGD